MISVEVILLLSISIISLFCGMAANSSDQLFKIYNGKKIITGILLETLHVRDEVDPIAACSVMGAQNAKSWIASLNSSQKICSLWSFNGTIFFTFANDANSILLVKYISKYALFDSTGFDGQWSWVQIQKIP